MRRKALATIFGRPVLGSIEADFAKLMDTQFAAFFEIKKIYATLHHSKLKIFANGDNLSGSNVEEMLSIFAKLWPNVDQN